MGEPVNNESLALLMSETASRITIPIAVVLDRSIDRSKKWHCPSWRVFSIVANEAAQEVGCRVSEHEGGKIRRYYWGGLKLELFKDGSEGYWYNLLSQTPYLFVICDGEAGDRVVKPRYVTANQDEATGHLESDDMVLSIAMPNAIRQLLEHYVICHYRPVKKKKRKRKDWLQDSQYVAGAGEPPRDEFLSRWSKRKLNTEISPLTSTAPLKSNLTEGRQAAESAPVNIDSAKRVDDKSLLTDEDMPDIDGLDENSDYAGFLSAGVSDKLRRLALRKLFRSPVFNLRDGLDDYDDDFRGFAALGDLITSDMKHQLEMAEQKHQDDSTPPGENLRAAADNEAGTPVDDQQENESQARPEAQTHHEGQPNEIDKEAVIAQAGDNDDNKDHEKQL